MRRDSPILNRTSRYQSPLAPDAREHTIQTFAVAADDLVATCCSCLDVVVEPVPPCPSVDHNRIVLRNKQTLFNNRIIPTLNVLFSNLSEEKRIQQKINICMYYFITYRSGLFACTYMYYFYITFIHYLQIRIFSYKNIKRFFEILSACQKSSIFTKFLLSELYNFKDEYYI